MYYVLYILALYFITNINIKIHLSMFERERKRERERERQRQIVLEDLSINVLIPVNLSGKKTPLFSIG